MKALNIGGLTCFLVELTVARSTLSENLGYLILESDPNPDYYAKSNFPPNIKHIGDKHLYLPVKKGYKCFQDIIFRKVFQLGEDLGIELSICPGQMTFHNEDHQFIRLNLNSSDQLPMLIKEFNNLGIQFFLDRKVKDYISLIYYKKYINFEYLNDGIYQDENNPYHFFFEIPKHIEFDMFKKNIEKIKNNCNYHLFDSFLAFLFTKNKIMDFFGIYSKHCDKNRFNELKKEIEKYFK